MNWKLSQTDCGKERGGGGWVGGKYGKTTATVVGNGREQKRGEKGELHLLHEIKKTTLSRTD